MESWAERGTERPERPGRSGSEPAKEGNRKSPPCRIRSSGDSRSSSFLSARTRASPPAAPPSTPSMRETSLMARRTVFRSGYR